MTATFELPVGSSDYAGILSVPRSRERLVAQRTDALARLVSTHGPTATRELSANRVPLHEAQLRDRPLSRPSWLKLLARDFRSDLICGHCSVTPNIFGVVAAPNLRGEPRSWRGPPALRRLSPHQLSLGFVHASTRRSASSVSGGVGGSRPEFAGPLRLARPAHRDGSMCSVTSASGASSSAQPAACSRRFGPLTPARYYLDASNPRMLSPKCANLAGECTRRHGPRSPHSLHHSPLQSICALFVVPLLRPDLPAGSRVQRASRARTTSLKSGALPCVATWRPAARARGLT